MCLSGARRMSAAQRYAGLAKRWPAPGRVRSFSDQPVVGAAYRASPQCAVEVPEAWRLSVHELALRSTGARRPSPSPPRPHQRLARQESRPP